MCNCLRTLLEGGSDGMAGAERSNVGAAKVVATAWSEVRSEMRPPMPIAVSVVVVTALL